jgi:hypothetical protein
MRTSAVLPLLVGRISLYAALVWFLLWTFRWTRTRSPLLAIVLALGIIVRAVLGSLLFAISYFELPFLRSLQLGGGFWTLAVDARSYFQAAASAAHLGIASVPEGSASPVYVRLLALWMDLVGVSPASAMLLNLVCYVLVAVLVVAASRVILPAAMALAAVTLSPALIIFGTQALKDSFCVALIVLAMAGVRTWINALHGIANDPRRDGVLGATCLSGAVFGLAGVRAYFALFVILAVCAMAVASIATAISRTERLKRLASHAALVPLLWVMFMIGGGAYYAYYGSVVNAALGHPFQTIAELDGARAGFVATGGATSVGDMASDDVPSPPLASAGITGSGVLARALRTARGGAVLFLPITLLRGLSIVSFTGGRGLLLITDLDTLVMDAGIIAGLLLLFRTRRQACSTPIMIFALVLAVLTTVSLAYVVTNYGTLFRLRLLAAAPIWVLPAFIRPTVVVHSNS